MVLVKLIGILLSTTGHALLYVSRRIYQTQAEKRTIPWWKDNGDKILRLNYDLNKHSIVFDLGGYEGQWASDIFAMYTCTIHVFEPVEHFAEHIEKRFRENDRIFVHRFGLSDRDGVSKIALDENASSMFKEGTLSTSIKLVRASNFLRAQNISRIDLIKVNIEGGEYDLLEHLISTGMVQNIANLQIQFHDFVPQAEKRMRAIQEKLERTHKLTYQYLFVWENWTLKEPSV